MNMIPELIVEFFQSTPPIHQVVNKFKNIDKIKFLLIDTLKKMEHVKKRKEISSTKIMTHSIMSLLQFIQ